MNVDLAAGALTETSPIQVSEARGVTVPDSGETQFAAALATAGAWTYTLETNREGRADVNGMAKGQGDSEALTMSPPASQTVMVTLAGANNEPGANDEIGVTVTADDNNVIATGNVLANGSEQDTSGNLRISALVAGRPSAG